MSFKLKKYSIMGQIQHIALQEIVRIDTDTR